MIFAATELDLLCGFIGGLFLSLSSSLHLALKGRITGMSGIYFGIISFDKSSLYWRTSLLIGMILSSFVLFQCFQFNKIFDVVTLFDPVFNMDSTEKFSHAINICMGGFFVGLGAKLMNGCTSGHGVCGLPRFSKRSFCAVMSFMFSGVLTATLRGEMNQDNHLVQKIPAVINSTHQFYLLITVIIIMAVIFALNASDSDKLQDIFISFIVGVLFTCGLLLSGMSKRSKVLGFLTLNKNWDPTLMMVMGGAVMGNLFSFNYILRKGNKPVCAKQFQIPTVTEVDWKIYAGGLLFGVGWGFGGICPGPAFTVIPLMGRDLMCYFLPTLAAGMHVGNIIGKMFPYAPLKNISKVN